MVRLHSALEDQSKLGKVTILSISLESLFDDLSAISHLILIIILWNPSYISGNRNFNRSSLPKTSPHCCSKETSPYSYHLREQTARVRYRKKIGSILGILRGWNLYQNSLRSFGIVVGSGWTYARIEKSKKRYSYRERPHGNHARCIGCPMAV